MKNIQKRDITGKCKDECHDRVLEATRRRQLEINRQQAKINSRQRYRRHPDYR